VPNLSSLRLRQNPALVALGDAIRRLRVERDISQERLALLAEVDRSYMGRVERGDNNVALLTLLKIANALDVTLTELMAEAGL
jgi:transcriptional regulator with XRE-family HTH domain